MSEEPVEVGNPGAGMTVEILQDIFAVPESYCLYDRDGVRIHRSLTLLGGAHGDRSSSGFPGLSDQSA